MRRPLFFRCDWGSRGHIPLPSDVDPNPASRQPPNAAATCARTGPSGTAVSVWRRVRRVVLLGVAFALVPVAVSYVQVLTSSSNAALGIRSVDGYATMVLRASSPTSRTGTTR